MSSVKLSPVTHTAEEVARLLQLAPLDREGGFFRRTAEAAAISPVGRRAWSVIYSLLTPEGFSALHRLAGDELWFFHAGDALESLLWHPAGGGEWVKLGLNATAGERLQDVVPAQTWQGTRLVPGGRWALVSCTVVPEFVWSDFELGERAALTAGWPDFAEGINALTRTEPPAGKL